MKKEILFGFMLKIASIGIKFILILVITNLFGANSYGQYTFILATFYIVAMIFRFGFDLFLQKKVAYLNSKMYPKLSLKYFIYVSLLSAVTLSIISLLFNYVSILLSNDLLNDINIFFRILPIYGLFILSVFFLRGLGKGIITMILYDILFPVLNVFFIFTIKNNYQELDVLFISFTTSLLITLFLIYYYIYKNSKMANLKIISLKNIFSRFALIPIYYSRHFLYIAVLFLFFSYTDILVLKLYVSDEILGIYAVDIRIASLLLIPSSIIVIIYGYKFSILNKNRDFKNLNNLNKKLSKYLFLIGIGMLIGLFILKGYILNIFGSEFNNNNNVLAIILFLAYFIHTPFGTYESVYTMTGHEKKYLKINLYSMLLNVFLNLFLGYYFKEVGIAISTLISILYLRIYQYYELKSVIRENTKKEPYSA